jgi:hypothetical protein
MKALQEVEVLSASDGSEWSASRPGPFSPRAKGSQYPLDKRLKGHWACLDAVEKRKKLFALGQ